MRPDLSFGEGLGQGRQEKMHSPCFPFTALGNANLVLQYATLHRASAETFIREESSALSKAYLIRALLHTIAVITSQGMLDDLEKFCRTMENARGKAKM